MSIDVTFDPSKLTPTQNGRLTGIMVNTISESEILPTGISISVPVQDAEDGSAAELKAYYVAEDILKKLSTRFGGYFQLERVKRGW